MTRKYRTSSSLKILSWNIQSLGPPLNPKTEDQECLSLFNSCDIVLLQETRKEPVIAGFDCVCSIRPNCRGGGVAILTRKEVRDGVKVSRMCNLPDDLVSITLSADYFGLDRDTVIMCIYARPKYSDIDGEGPQGKETIISAEELLSSLNGVDIILGGDLNARVGSNPCTVAEWNTDCEGAGFYPMPEDYIPDQLPPRSTRDPVVGGHHKEFVSLVQNCQLHLLNGRTLGDVTGDFTSIQYNGCTVIDYFAVSSPLANRLDYMRILPLTNHSDHRPLLLVLKTSPGNSSVSPHPTEAHSRAPTRFIHNPDQLISFRDSLPSDLSDLFVTSIIRSAGSNPSTSDASNACKAFSDHITTLADSHLSRSKPASKNKRPRKPPWANSEIKEAKGAVNDARSLVNADPQNDHLRHSFYKTKAHMRKVSRKHMMTFLGNENRKIEEGLTVDWKQLNKLKQLNSTPSGLDTHDLNSFHSFFQDLYKDTHPTLDAARKEQLLEEADLLAEAPCNAPELNDMFSTTEVEEMVKKLKRGKAAGDDAISNEILKNLNQPHIELLTCVFNLCFKSGAYAWNNSLITPLHKKGPRNNPDNYRAVAVGSAVGKLYSSLLLSRLQSFRKHNCPDHANQLGFCPGAQTCDHLFTLQTLVDKFKKARRPLYGVFIDLRKAFDSVPRQALFYKLARMGITGNFYRALRTMYSSTTSQIKISGFLSRKFRTEKGTEQGHALSPDLFKIYLHDLSPQLDKVTGCPTLSGLPLSHLLWADDLVLLATNPVTAQKLLDVLNKFCNDWGLEINVGKTKTLVFNAEHTDSPLPQLKLGSNVLENTHEYCYLGINLQADGKYKKPQADLCTKATRAVYSLKKSIMRDVVSTKSLFILFDTLIKPILFYGGPVWSPRAYNICKILGTSMSSRTCLKRIAADPTEKVHIGFLKWALGVNRRTSNAAVWRLSGRPPLALDRIRHTLSFLKRLQTMDKSCLAKRAYMEQEKYHLPWFKSILPIIQLDEIYRT